MVLLYLNPIPWMIITHIIDPGHSMCSRKEFIEKGPAGSYLQKENQRIYVIKWTDQIIQEEQSVRFDLILEEPY